MDESRRYELYRNLNAGYVLFSLLAIAVGLIFINKVQTAPPPERLIPIKEYGHWQHTVIKTRDDYVAEYYEDLAELEERTMARILEYQEPTEEWFETYEDVNEMFEEVGQPDEVEEVYVADDIDYLYRAVETEVHGGTFEGKVNVANVILNRLNHSKFPNTLKGVVTSPNQFKYNKTKIPEDTINAVSYAYEFPDTTMGAVAFRKTKSTEDWNGMYYLFTDSGYTKPSPEEINDTPQEESEVHDEG